MTGSARSGAIAAMLAPALRRSRPLVLWLTALAFWLGTMPVHSVETVAPAVFLVAKEDLQDPNFVHSVVLVVFPKDAGPLGVILNRPVPLTLKEVFPEEPRL